LGVAIIRLFFKYIVSATLSLYCIALLSCESKTSTESAIDLSLENTLNMDLSGESGNVDDYFYDLSSDGIDATYHYYDSRAISNPQFYFDPLTDRLNFLTFPCYLMTLTQSNLGQFDNSSDEAAGNLITTRRLESQKIKHVEQDIIIKSTTYSNIQKMTWNDENSRYVADIQGGQFQTVDYSFDPDLGADGCPNQYEDGLGGCTCDYPVNCLESDINYGSDNCPDDYEDGEGGCVCDFSAGMCTTSDFSGLGLDPNNDNDINGDDYSASNLNGSEGDGEYNAPNQYTDIYNELEYKVPYDVQTMGDIQGMIYLDTLEWVRNDSIYYNPNPYAFTHTFTLPKNIISSDSLMWSISTDCNENNSRDIEPERYVVLASECLASEIYISNPELFVDTGDDGCYDSFEDGNGGCQLEENYGLDGCPDAFEDGQGGCICVVGSEGCIPDINYIEGQDPNLDNDVNGDNYSLENNPSGTQGNQIYNSGEPFTDIDNDNIYDTGFCDRTNGIWDPKEAHLDLEDIGDNIKDDGEPFQDRNCNELYDSGEKTDSDGVNQSQCESTFNGVWNTDAEVFSFCDLGNGKWDDVEVCSNGDSSCNATNLYSLSDRPNSLVVSYVDSNGAFDINSPVVLDEVSLGDDIINRWGDTYSDLIETIQLEDVRTETVSLIDSIVVVNSNPIIQQLDQAANDYYIAKSTWSDDGVDDYDYHIFKKGDEGYIYKLNHKSYFVPPGFSSNWWFEDNPTDEVFLYTVNGLFRDGERQGSIDTVRTVLGEYIIKETYAVDRDSVIVPMRADLGSLINGNIFCAKDQAICSDCVSIGDCSADTTFYDSFRVTREKLTTLEGYGSEYLEKGITYFVKNYGIVKDDVQARWNINPDCLDEDGYSACSEEALAQGGVYRWEMIRKADVDNQCSNSSVLQSLINNKKNINMKDFERTGDFNNHPYKKTRTYGLQRILEQGGDTK